MTNAFEEVEFRYLLVNGADASVWRFKSLLKLLGNYVYILFKSIDAEITWLLNADFVSI